MTTTTGHRTAGTLTRTADVGRRLGAGRTTKWSYAIAVATGEPMTQDRPLLEQPIQRSFPLWRYVVWYGSWLALGTGAGLLVGSTWSSR